jgi:hypothetical protein
MGMEARLREVRAALAGLGARGRTTRIPDAVRTRVIVYAREQRSRGKTWRSIAEAVGLSATVLQRWMRAAPEASCRLARVKVVADPEAIAAVSLISPSGYRIEGVTLEAALRALEALH